MCLRLKAEATRLPASRFARPPLARRTWHVALRYVIAYTTMLTPNFVLSSRANRLLRQS